MPELVRLSFSIEKSLLKQLERLTREDHCENRSEFIRGLIRNRLVEEDWRRDREALATITLVYDHHSRQLSKKLLELQHHHHTEIMASTHIHLDEHRCAEMIMMKGRPERIRKIAALLRQQKGTLHAALSLSCTGEHLT